MKFSFFHLMPYPYLPDDFDTAYDSSALTYPNANFSPELGASLYARYLDELELLAAGQAVVGSAASVAERLGELYDELGGFGQIIGLFAIGPSTHQQVMHSAELFATEVMPVLRPLGTKATVPDTREAGR